MLSVLLKKIWQVLPVLVLVSLGSFFLLELVPGDPAATVLGPGASPAEYAAVRDRLGLNEPVVERYTSWVGGVATGDLGQSIFPPNRDVTDLITQRLPVTIEIALLSMILTLLIAIPLAMRTAYRPNDGLDRIATTGAFAALATPPFLAGLLFVFFAVFNPGIVKVGLLAVGVVLAYYLGVNALRRVRRCPPGPARTKAIMFGIAGLLVPLVIFGLLARYLPSFPRQGYARITDEGLRKNLKSVALPVFTLTLTECAVSLRILRRDLIDTLGEDFILAARAKGMPAWRILLKDALRPSLFSLITIMSVTLGRLIGGSVIVETIFNLPGMGRLMVESITSKDYPVVQACVLIIGVIYVLSSAFVDVAYNYLDPRVRRA
ncbi:MAG TPA: ABC transporter permease [Ilumatobacter sp.]|nr:ABC transporter permease [Ilumatobacter sp.]